MADARAERKLAAILAAGLALFLMMGLAANGSEPGKAVAIRSHAQIIDWQGRWQAEAGWWTIELEVDGGGAVSGHVICDGSKFSVSLHGGASEYGRANFSGRLTPEGRIETHIEPGQLLYRTLTGTLPRLELSAERGCLGASFLMRRSDGLSQRPH